MPRSARKESGVGIYHVMMRGINRQAIFDDDEDCRRFMDILADLPFQHDDDGSVIESVVLSQEDGLYGVDIPKGVWHKLESLESGSVIFECKEGPFVPHEVEGVLNVNDN